MELHHHSKNGAEMTINPLAHQPTEPFTEESPSPGPDGSMRAILQARYGPVEALREGRTERPSIKADEVLIRVQAAGLDRGTWHSMTGKPYLMRIMGFGFRRPKNRVVGLDVAGTVVAVGSEVTRFVEGDDVFGISRGSFAEYAVAREDKLAAKPVGTSFVEAAVVPISGITALQAVRDAGRVQAGQHVLVIGASGGVGTYAVQLAKAFGAEVTGVSSSQKTDLVRSLGADHVIDYSQRDFADGRRRYDVILDIGGNSPLSRLRSALTDTGTLVIGGGESGGSLTGGFGRQLRAVAVSPFLRQRLTMQMTKQRSQALETLAELLAAGRLSPSIDRTYTLSEAPDAMRHLEAGRVRGKVALTIPTS